MITLQVEVTCDHISCKEKIAATLELRLQNIYVEEDQFGDKEHEQLPVFEHRQDEATKDWIVSIRKESYCPKHVPARRPR